MQREALGTSLILFFALLACKGEQPNGSAAASTSASAEKAPPAEQLDKSAVCGLYGAKSGSERCSDCVDEAEMGDKCSAKEEAWGRCAGDVEKFAGACATSCVEKCMGGQKACCECSADCVATKRANCVNQFLAHQKCIAESCKKSCG